MKRVIAALLLAGMLGCATVEKIESGDRAIGEGLMVSLDGAWNQVKAPGMGPAQIWTMEGLPVDQLLIYSGIKDGQAIHAEGAGLGQRKTFSFRSSMQPDDVVAMFEGMLTRDGSIFRLIKLEPSSFCGEKGFRFEYSLTRKIDNVQLLGVGYGAVKNGQLYAILYLAPKLTFFSRHHEKVEKIALSARLKA